MSNSYRWLTPDTQLFMGRDYLLPGQSVDERVDIICNRAESILGIKGYGAKLKLYIQKGWYSLSTPIWANFGVERGLPISCFGSYMEDDTASILKTLTEVGMMTKYGGGTSAYFGELRGRGAPIRNNGESSGSVHFMQLYESLINVISQGSTRRGSFAAYLPIDHPDIEEFLSIRSDGSLLQTINFGVSVPNQWLEEMIAGDAKKRGTWAKVLASRAATGFPYIVFIDNVNDGKPDVYKDKELMIYDSNLCTEIFLPKNNLESFVCDLASLNVHYFDEWKDTDAPEVLVYLLDAVATEFIEKGSKIEGLERAVRFTERHRALGIGQFGWHSYLQSKSIPYESFEAKLLNTKIARHIKEAVYAASAKMAAEFGEPELLKGYGRRHATLLAIAPTKSSAFIIEQTSESTEPFLSNYEIKDLAKGKFTVRNRYLTKLLEEKGQNTEPVWVSILEHAGSVQHLDFLTEHEKQVFRTLAEISPKEIIIQAAQRQKFIDQGQSINLLIPPGTPTKDVNALILEAWRLGIKSLYYQYSENAAQAFAKKQNILECTSCES